MGGATSACVIYICLDGVFVWVVTRLPPFFVAAVAPRGTCVSAWYCAESMHCRAIQAGVLICTASGAQWIVGILPLE